MKRKFLFNVIGFFLRVLLRFDIVGLEKVSLEGGVLLVLNHLSRLDPVALFIFIDRDDFTGMVAKKYQDYPLISWLVRTLSGIWIDRENPHPRSLRKAINHLKQGGMLGIAAEGTRSTSKALIAAKTGVAYLACKANVPVLPVAIWGTENAVSKMLLLKRPVISIRFGDPLVVPVPERRERDIALQTHTDEIMCHIAAMLPPKYRGAYAEHPCLKELLTTQ